MIHDQDRAFGLNHIFEIDILILAGFHCNALMIPTFGEIIQQHARHAIKQYFLLSSQLYCLADAIIFSHTLGDEESTMLALSSPQRFPNGIAAVEQVTLDLDTCRTLPRRAGSPWLVAVLLRTTSPTLRRITLVSERSGAAWAATSVTLGESIITAAGPWTTRSATSITFGE